MQQTRLQSTSYRVWAVNSCCVVWLGFQFLLIGCENTQRPTSTSPAKTNRPGSVSAVGTSAGTVPADDMEAIKRLTESGFKLLKNKEGRVIGCSAAPDDESVELIRLIAGLPNLEQVTLSGPGIKDEGLEVLAELPRLKRLNLAGSVITDATMTIVGKIVGLTVLKLQRTSVSDAGMPALAGLQQLRALDLRSTNLSNTGMVQLASLPSLEDLQIERTRVTDAGLVHLAGLPLKAINVNRLSVGDEGLKVLAQLTTLQSLQMDSTSVTDEGMQVIAGLTRLKRLRMRETDITGTGFQFISGMTDLQLLELRLTSIDDAGLQIISQLPNVEYLDISECKLVSSEGIGRHLSRLIKLKYLGLWETKLDDSGLAMLAPLTALTELKLESTNLTNDAVPTLLGFQQLQRLNVSGTQLDDVGIRRLISELPGLQWINLANTGISLDLLDELYEQDDLEFVD